MRKIAYAAFASAAAMALAAVKQKGEYQPDDRGLFCRNCGRTSIRHFPWHGKRLCDLPKENPDA